MVGDQIGLRSDRRPVARERRGHRQPWACREHGGTAAKRPQTRAGDGRRETARRCSRSSTCRSTSRSSPGWSSTARSARCTRSTTSRSLSTRARRSGIVGESGCGKTTLIRALVRLIDADPGAIRFRGADITKAGRKQLEPIRRQMQMVFQDPQASLNPRKRVGADPGHAAADPRRRQATRSQRGDGHAAGSRRPAPRASQPLPARVLRRPAPADRDRPGAGGQSEADAARRAGVGAGRLDPGAGDQPARRAPGRAVSCPTCSSPTT